MIPNRKLFAGIFLIALSTLMYEILLTRIFSVTMGYHFAFMAVSIAMFGMTAGAIFVYLYPKFFGQNEIEKILARNSFLFSLSIVLSFLFHVFVPFVHSLSFTGFIVMVSTYTVISIPFIFSGICICLLLTRYPESVNKLYASDLIGAALGCILVVSLISISGGPTAVFFTAFIASLVPLIFSSGKRLLRKPLIYTLALGSFAVVHTFMVNGQAPLIRLFWVRGDYEPKPLYEKWNSFSRVNIDGDSTRPEVPFGWGLSNSYDRSKKVRQLMLNIDAHSTTILSKFDGDTTKLEHLTYDVANIVHYLRRDSDVLVIGSGGGRDVLSSLKFGQRSVLAIEINKDMISAVNDEFGGFTGHLDRYPNIKFVGDEARSYVSRLDDKFDIIQISVIDNWSATSSGAFVLTENSLYTTDSWKTFLQRLKPGGIMTVTRFWRKRPAEMYRLASITSESLRQLGIKNPRENMIIVKCNSYEREESHSGTGTLLVSMQPFSAGDLNTIDSVSNSLQFDVMLSPSVSRDSIFTFIASHNSTDGFIKEFPVNIVPPTDDKPFFFHLLKFRDIMDVAFWKEWDLAFNIKAIFILLSLFVTMLILTTLCVIVPLKMTAKRFPVKGTAGLFIFFSSIGLGFMLVEISQIQRLSIFLGHPTYSIAAALFTLLLSSGLGSFAGGRIFTPGKRFSVYLMLALLLISLICFGLLTPLFAAAFRQYDTPVRVIVSALILFPVGFFMGTAFPFGIKAASQRSGEITPWLWGINGVTSVLATVISIMISMTWGISASYWTGFACYAFAGFSILHYLKKNVPISKLPNHQITKSPNH